MTLPNSPLVVGIPACSKMICGQLQHAAPARYGAALMGGAGAIPVLIPPVGEAELALLDRLDGLLLNGSPSNVEPSRYGADEDLTPDRHDPHRDATTLLLVRAALARGMPVLAICRGIQELNVALGGTLHQQIQTVPGRFDHRAGDGTLDEQYSPRHDVTLSGSLARMLGATGIRVNSLHEQAIDRLGEGLAAEALAPDGTIEGVRVLDAPGFAYAVQWHPEWRYAEDAASVALFRAFGDACRSYARGQASNVRGQKVA
ncbi:MAG: gamma-glutamyl-gamma-aminobutyrate hydrolase family protein [Acidisphaera sp.]|nr:gamma-glutamyl-gamma-aminobutyrate hydrolase family protein [Acidisphaera sp.]